MENLVKEAYSKKLGLLYKITINGSGEKIFTFQDGVVYSEKEVNEFKNCSVEALKNTHAIKKIFNGEIIEYN